jgi:hypothetical protein
MYNIQDYSVIYNNAAHSVICEGRVHKTNLILPLFIEVPASTLESERSCICVLEVSILSLFLWFSIRFSSVFVVQSNYVVSFSFLWRYSLGHVMKLLTVQIIWGQDTQTTWGTIHITKTNKTKTTPKNYILRQAHTDGGFKSFNQAIPNTFKYIWIRCIRSSTKWYIVLLFLFNVKTRALLVITVNYDLSI